jgi:hypothetical protein
MSGAVSLLCCRRNTVRPCRVGDPQGGDLEGDLHVLHLDGACSEPFTD